MNSARKVRGLIAVGPALAAMGLVVGQTHLIHNPEVSDFAEGLLLGAGVGVSIFSLILTRKQKDRR